MRWKPVDSRATARGRATTQGRLPPREIAAPACAPHSPKRPVSDALVPRREARVRRPGASPVSRDQRRSHALLGSSIAHVRVRGGPGASLSRQASPRGPLASARGRSAVTTAALGRGAAALPMSSRSTSGQATTPRHHRRHRRGGTRFRRPAPPKARAGRPLAPAARYSIGGSSMNAGSPERPIFRSFAPSERTANGETKAGSRPSAWFPGRKSAAGGD